MSTVTLNVKCPTRVVFTQATIQKNMRRAASDKRPGCKIKMSIRSSNCIGSVVKSRVIQRLSKVVLGAYGFIVANCVLALGLGDITLKSNLNQTLNAEIEILELRGLSNEEILVKLADAEDFDNLGVDRIYLLNDLKFVIDTSASPGPVIRVVSSRPVREPFLNFIVEARWPSGKLLREYTILLDLPVFSDSSAAPVSPVQTQTLSSGPDSTTSARSPVGPTQANPRSAFDEGVSASATNAPAPVIQRSDYAGGEEYAVEKNDTLWEIALGVRPDSSVSVHKTMLALQRMNPDAFINGNINLLRSGTVLRIPTGEEITRYNQRQAIQEVAEQNALWRGNRAAPLDASNVLEENTGAVESGEGRLTLVSPEDSDEATQGRISGSEGASSTEVSALQVEAATTQELIDIANSGNTELRSKIGSLDEQVETIESMIEISSENLRALELQAEQARQNADSADLLASDTLDEGAPVSSVDEYDASSPVSGEEQEFSDTSAVDDVSGEAIEASDLYEDLPETDVVEETVEAVATPAPVATSAPVVAPAQAPKQSLMDLAMQYLPYIGGGIVVLIAGLFFVMRRKSSDDDEFDDLLGGDSDYSDQSSYEDLDTAAESDLDMDFGSGLDTELELPEETVAEVESEDLVDIDSDIAPEPQTEDVVAESDIYIAYGKYDQAEDMLSKALEQDPGLHDARVKILEIYAAQEKLEEFDRNYSALIELNAGQEKLDRAAELRTGFESAGAFRAASSSSNLDLDLGQSAGSALEEDTELSFDLDLEDASESIDMSVSTDIDLSNEEFDLDADLLSGAELNDGLDITDNKSGVESLESVEDTIDTDRYLDPDDTGAEEAIESDDLDLDLDFDLDLGDDAPKVAEAPARQESTEDEMSIDADFDLDGLDDIDITKDLEDLEVGLAGGDSLSMDTLSADLESGLDDIDIELGEPEAKTATAAKEQAAPGGSDSVSSGFDLSALDSELDQLSSNLNADGIDLESVSSDEFGEFSESALDISEVDMSELENVDLSAQSETTGDTTLIREVTPVKESKGEVLDFELPDIDPEASDDDDLDFLSSSDETETKLDLAAAYIDMGDTSGAKEIIDEIMKEGSETQKAQANGLLAQLDG